LLVAFGPPERQVVLPTRLAAKYHARQAAPNRAALAILPCIAAQRAFAAETGTGGRRAGVDSDGSSDASSRAERRRADDNERQLAALAADASLCEARYAAVMLAERQDRARIRAELRLRSAAHSAKRTPAEIAALRAVGAKARAAREARQRAVDRERERAERERVAAERAAAAQAAAELRQRTKPGASAKVNDAVKRAMVVPKRVSARRRFEEWFRVWGGTAVAGVSGLVVLAIVVLLVTAPAR
jgi:hypothetical protein